LTNEVSLEKYYPVKFKFRRNLNHPPPSTKFFALSTTVLLPAILSGWTDDISPGLLYLTHKS